MPWDKLVSLGSKTFAVCRTVGGLLLVLAAMASPARAMCDPGMSAPEIDPGALTSALTLLTGGALVVADRFRR
jgi:hypothetical protein